MKSTFLSRKTNTSDRRTTLSVSYLVSALAVVGMVACTTTVTPAPDSCGVDSSVVCSSGTGWSCTGDAQPEDTNSGLVCSTDGVGDFCCDQSACAYDSTISCVTGAAGYSCAIGSSPPDSADATLVCSAPTLTSADDEYCCYTNTITPPAGATCAQDPTVAGCAYPSYGFSCSGTDAPTDDFSGITCSAGVGSAPTTYCCVYN